MAEVDRAITGELLSRLAHYPGVVLLGPRQVGKSTLARSVADSEPDALMLDLERASDRARLVDAERSLASLRDRLLILDEVQSVPDLFNSLRPEIDADRRAGRFLLLGSTSGNLLRQRSESLAGRVSYLELAPFATSELPLEATTLQRLWLRGGFPLSFLSPSDATSYRWRLDFIDNFLQRDLPTFGVGVAATTLHRFWRMLAHLQGQLLNASQLGSSMGGISHVTVGRYVDVMVDTMMVRRLEPELANVGKRLVKSPKLYVRDSGLVHALLSIASIDDLQSHPVVGASWEGFCVEQIHAQLPPGASTSFYRTAAGAEIDLVVTMGRRKLGFEMKLSSAPTVTRGFWQSIQDLRLDHAYVVAPVEARYPIAADADVVTLADLPSLLAA